MGEPVRRLQPSLLLQLCLLQPRGLPSASEPAPASVSVDLREFSPILVLHLSVVMA